MQRLRTVYLHGTLADDIGTGPHQMMASSIKDIMSFFEGNYGNFNVRIRDMGIGVVLGNPDDEVCLHEDRIDWNLPTEEIHLVPETEGGKGNWFKAIIGGLLIGIAIIGSFGAAGFALGAPLFGGALFGITGTTLAVLGAGLVLSAFAATPKSTYADRTDDSSSVYTGPLNTQAQGTPMPLILGRELIGGGVIFHTSIDIEAA